MRLLLRLLAGSAGMALVATSFYMFFHAVPAGWVPPEGEPIVSHSDVRLHQNNAWYGADQTRVLTYRDDGGAIEATSAESGAIGPHDANVRVRLSDGLEVQAVGASGLLWSFPPRSPLAPRPGSVPIAVVRMTLGSPVVVATDQFFYEGPAEVGALTVEHWSAFHDRHSFLDDGRRFERVVERHAFVEPVSGIVVAWKEHERVWMHWGDVFATDPVRALLLGPVARNAYVEVWHAWTNTTDASAAELAGAASSVRSDRILQMVGYPAPALLAGEIGLWFMIAPPRRLFGA